MGVGETTTYLKNVPAYNVPGTDKTIHIWDTPGKNEEFNIKNYEFMRKFASADKIFILNKKDCSSVKEMIQVLYKLHPEEIYYIRTQCDSGLALPTVD